MFGCGRNERSSPAPEFHDHKLTGLPGTVATVAYAKNGADDPVVPDDQTLAFWKEMREAEANWEFVAYGKALHTFANWLMPEDGPPPAAYNNRSTLLDRHAGFL